MSELDVRTAERPAAPAAVAEDPAAGRRRERRRRRLTVQGLRVLTAIVWIGSWELTTRLHLVDPFFFGMPSGILGRLATWTTEGTALGPLWRQVLVTMQETVLGFLVGAAAGVVVGVLLSK